MAPTFKITFPLPGRRQGSSPAPTPNSFLSTPSDYDDSPPFYPSPKAEEILGAGASELNIQNTPKKSKLKKERKGLRKLPSFMSVTLADVEGESPNSEEGFPFPGMRTADTLSPNQNVPRPSNRLSRHGSSPVLGNHQTVTTTEADYFSDRNGPLPRHAESSTGLRSHYDKSKMPLLTAQQTSASSMRDMALRKGYPNVSSPLAQETMNTLATPDLSRSHSRNVSKDSDGSRVTASSKIASIPRRRPSVLDRPTLHPDGPPDVSHAVSPPTALINASLPKPMQPGDYPQMAVGKSRWWGKRKARASPPMDTERTHVFRPSENEFSSVKVNVKRPKAGVRNWFDTVETDDVALESISQNDHYTHFVSTESLTTEPLSARTPSTVEQILLSEHHHRAPSPASTQRKSSFNSKTRSNASDKKLTFKLDPSPTRASQHRVSHRYSLSKSAPTSPTGSRSFRSTEGQRGIPLGIDLQLQSILNLSSSDDEDEQNATESYHQGHRTKGSVERVDQDSDIVVGSAQRVQPVKPRPMVNKTPRKTPRLRSNSSGAVPPVPQIPARPQLNQRSSSIRWRELLEDRKITQSVVTTNTATTTDIEAGESTLDSGASSPIYTTPSSTPLHTPSTRQSKRSSAISRGGKMMKVTMEEEKLLEAMREKRASIRANDFQKGFSSAMQQMRTSDLISRPRTAGADGGGPTSTARSSYCALSTTTGITAPSSHGSVTPPLLSSAIYRAPLGSGHIYKASLGTMSRMSASADDLTLDESYPFPHIASEPLSPSLFLSPEMRSHTMPPPQLDALTFASSNPGLSFSHLSENLPPTPSTRDSPVTPPPGHHHALSVYGGGSHTVRPMSPPRSVRSSANSQYSGPKHQRHYSKKLSLPSNTIASTATTISEKPTITKSNAATADATLDPSAEDIPEVDQDSDHAMQMRANRASGVFHHSGDDETTDDYVDELPSLDHAAFGARAGAVKAAADHINSKDKDKGNGPGHERQRTTSSSVVVLDGMESYAARVDEENDLGGWGMERW